MNAAVVAERMMLTAARNIREQMEAKQDLAEVNAKKAAHLDWLLACVAKTGITVRRNSFGDLVVSHGITEEA